MDGVHDLGGVEGFGPVVVEADEPVFHEPWEGRVFALAGAALGAGGFNTPMFRHAIERMEPRHLLTASYYEKWLTAVASLLVEHGHLDAAELEASGPFPRSLAVRVAGDDVAIGPAGPAYAVGDRVRVRNVRFSGHTRCPAYVRGCPGTVVRVDGEFPVPELEAHRREKRPAPTYSVRFEAVDLWGEAGDPVHVDLYHHHLEPEGEATDG